MLDPSSVRLSTGLRQEGETLRDPVFNISDAGCSNKIKSSDSVKKSLSCFYCYSVSAFSIPAVTNSENAQNLFPWCVDLCVYMCIGHK